MDQSTWESVPRTCRSLLGRVGVVMTHSMPEASMHRYDHENMVITASVANAVSELALREDVADIFVIGGPAAYEE
eukprot:9397147-Pyramimonas_sp.AAC.1